MGIRSKAFGLVAAIILSLSAAGSALADPTASGSDTGDLTVTLTETGVFSVEITAASLANLGVLASSSTATTSGQITIRYTDTKSYRNGFFARLSASNFASNTLVVPPYRPNPGTPYTIPASNLRVTKNYNPAQGRFSNPIGDIGPCFNGNMTEFPGSTTPMTNPGPGNVGYNDWTTVTALPFSSLEAPRTIARGLAGSGTAGNQLGTAPFPAGTEHKLDITLTVPAGQPADVYTSTLSVVVSPPGP